MVTPPFDLILLVPDHLVSPLGYHLMPSGLSDGDPESTCSDDVELKILESVFPW